MTLINIDRDSPVSWLLFPLRGDALSVLVVFALLNVLADAAGLLGIWLKMILLVAIWAYAFRLLDSVAEGRHQPPEMSASTLNPVDERRPLWLLLVAGIGYGINAALGPSLPAAAGAALGYILLALLPAAIAILSLHDAAPTRILNPLDITRAVRGMGKYYLVCLLVLVLGVFLFRFAAVSPLLRPVSVFLQLYALLVVFSVIGGTLYLRRHELGTATVDSPEQRTARELLEQDKAHDEMIDEIYRLSRAGKLTAAYEQIKQQVTAPGSPALQRARMFESLSRWDDKRLALRIGRELVGELIEIRRSGDALDVMTRCLEWDPTFRPSRAADAIRLVNEARDRGQVAVADTILTDFEASYPNDPAVSVARTLRGG